MTENSQDSVALSSSLNLLFGMIKQVPGNFGINALPFVRFFFCVLINICHSKVILHAGYASSHPQG